MKESSRETYADSLLSYLNVVATLYLKKKRKQNCVIINRVI